MAADKTKMAATLLLADDSVTIQRVIELTFADEDVTVIAVSDGDAAIACVEDDPPDIVLADVGMPGKNGYEVASYIKHSPLLSHIPVLLLTGAFEPVDRRKASEAGCDGVLAKPFEPQLVINRVRELLNRSRGGAVAPRAIMPPPVPAPVGEWALPEAPGAGTSAGASKTEALGDFFDELDAAFSKLPGARRETPLSDHGPDLGESSGERLRPVAESPDAEDIWDFALPVTGDVDLPLSLGSPRSELDRQPPQRPAMREPPPQPAATPARPSLPVRPSPAPPTQAMPALAEAFATLLAAEQPGAAPADTATWAPPPAPAVTDDVVERVTRLVLERLSDRVVRETAAELVSEIAERLVREEIGRIKAALK